MKTQFIKHILLTFFVLAGLSVSAQTEPEADKSNSKYDTLELHVEGVCNMCKARIEQTVYDMKGVKTVEWDLQTGTLTTVVKSGKVTKEDIAMALAEKGHRSELMEAVPEAYKDLPGCCRYDDGVQKHGIEHK